MLEIKTCKTTNCIVLYCVLDDGCTVVAFEGMIDVHTHNSCSATTRRKMK